MKEMSISRQALQFTPWLRDQHRLGLDGLWFAVKTEKHQRGGVSFERPVAAQTVMSTLDATHRMA
jgi:hypothetical protein